MWALQIEFVVTTIILIVIILIVVVIIIIIVVVIVIIMNTVAKSACMPVAFDRHPTSSSALALRWLMVRSVAHCQSIVFAMVQRGDSRDAMYM